MKIELDLDFAVRIDPYRRDTGGQTEPRMSIVVGDDITVVVSQECPGDTAVRVASLREVSVALPIPSPDEEAFGEYVRSDAASGLLHRIAVGYGCAWSGGRPGMGHLEAVLDDSALSALAELEIAIESLPASSLVFWNCDEWFRDVDWRDITATEVDGLVADPACGDHHVRFIEDPGPRILARFAESLQKDLEHAANVAGVHVLAGSVRGALVTVDSGRLVIVRTPAGNR